MGAWGVLPFDNDSANDWAYGLEEVSDLSLVRSALSELERVGGQYLDQDIACRVLAACEVLSRLLGKFGYRNASTAKVDEWVAQHPIQPEPALLERALAGIDRILGEDSELRELWGDGDDGAWRQSVEELRRRLMPR